MESNLPDTHPLPKTLTAYLESARECMTAESQAYFLGGAGEERTLRRNEEAFARANILPRPLQAMGGGSTATNLLGRVLDCPVLVAPFAYHRLLDPSGEIASAQGAEAQAIRMILSAQSSVAMTEVRSASPGCDWFQLFWLGSREATLALARTAVAAGFETLVLTIDAPVQGVRDREIEAGFGLPAEVQAVNLAQVHRPQFAPLAPGESLVFDRIAHSLPSWKDVTWLIEAISVPVLLKGILHPDDAAMAVKTGAAGIIVSNHGGRVLDGAPATLEMLPAIVRKVGPDYPVLLDSGIRRGVDILVALALGAKAVLVGRPVVCGLAVAGALGVSHVLRMLRDELEIAMLLSGCATISDISRDIVHLNR